MTQLSPSQQIAWDILTRDPASFAHRWGPVLTQLKGKALHSRYDDLLWEIMQFSVEDAIGIVKTFLCTYQLPLDVSRLDNFDRFYKKCRDYIMENAGNLTVLERRESWNDKP